MIQKYTCIPKSDYNVLVVTNGTIDQVESKLIEINEQTHNEIPLNSNITYLDNFKQLLKYIHKNDGVFIGKVLFMFFNGLGYIQDLLSDLIDHYNNCNFLNSIQYPYNRYTYYNKISNKYPSFGILENTYFYFDSSVSVISPSYLINDSYHFNTIVTIANDVLKKISFMVGRIRGLYIDDRQSTGERVYPLHCLMRNFPNVERIELTSNSQILMNGMIL